MTVRFTVVRGVERVNFSELGIYAGLRNEGFSPELLCSTRSRVTEADAGMPVRRLRLPLVASRIAPTLVGGYLIGQVSAYRYYHQYLLGFHRAVRSVDVLCPVDLGHPTSYQSVQERKFGKKVVVQCWDNIPFNWPHDRPIRQHYEAVLDGADHFLALTDDSRRALRTMGVAEERISRVNIGVNIDFWSPSESARDGRAPLELLFVGRLDWMKGVHTLIEALDLVRASVRLTVVGAGGQDARLRWLLESRRRRSNLPAAPSVRFLGPRYGEELRALRRSSDVQLVPSIPTPQWREQLNQGMLEGMACGLPTIASATGAIPEVVVDRESGLLVPPDVPAEWARAIDYLADRPEERRRMGGRARHAVIERFGLAQQTHLLAGVLREKVLGH